MAKIKVASKDISTYTEYRKLIEKSREKEYVDAREKEYRIGRNIVCRQQPTE